MGIGGGIPRPRSSTEAIENIHLGDVVVGCPDDGGPACVYHERGRIEVDGEFETIGMVQNPDHRIASALGLLRSDHKMEQTTLDDQLARLRRHKTKKKFAYPGLEYDRLFKVNYRHVGDYYSRCADCDPAELVQRPQRSVEEQNAFVFHLGRIATGNAVVQDGVKCDQIGNQCNGAICVEMEAAGVDSNRRCLIIRGISDYADSHKSDLWRSYAAGKAAAFARELLCRLPADTVRELEMTPKKCRS